MAKQDRVVADNQERVEPVVPMYNREMLGIALTGLGVGLIVFGAAYLLNRYVFSGIMCQGDGAGCSESPTYSMIVAMVIGALLGLVALVQTRVYRPLLVVLGATVGLWGLFALTSDMAWYWGLVIVMALFGLSYALFAWVARIRAFPVSIIVTIVLVVAMRLILGL